MPPDSQARKYQLTINNPQDKGLTHEEIKRRLGELRSVEYFCLADEVGEEGTPHTHVYLVARSPIRFSTIKKKFDTAHIETARGSNMENRAYVAKSGEKWVEKAATSVPGTFEEYGDLPPDRQPGERTDLDEIAELIEAGQTPNQIMAQYFPWRRYEKMIRSGYFAKRRDETPTVREVKVHYLVGESGSGKSYTYTTLCEEQGEEAVFFLTDYDGGGFDNYNGEPILFMDEYKGQFRFAHFLVLTDKYKSQIHARYANVVSLWNEIYITSVFPPEELYKKMVEEDIQGRDKQKQLMRRITDITYCFIDENGAYQKHTIPMSEYKGYDALKAQALHIPEGFYLLDEAEAGELPFP